MDEAQAERFAVEAAKDDNEEVQEMVITWEETLADREARGEARGVTRGVARGFLQATRHNILRVLNRRLKSVPAFVSQKLEAIRSIERLEEILDQALSVDSVNELGLDREPSK